MKTFSTNGTGSQQTLSELETDKLPLYNSLADAEADIANLEEGQIVATKDTGDELAQPVDTVEAGNLHAVTSNAVADYTKGVKVTTVKGTTESNGYLTFSLPQGSIGIVLNGVVTNLNSVVVEVSRYQTTMFLVPKEINGNLLPSTYVEIDIAYI